MLLRHCPPSFSFAAFVIWLLAVPMDGPLAGAAGLDSLISWFLPAHIFSLFAIGYFCLDKHLEHAAPIAVPLAVILTLLLPLFPDALPWLAVLLGLSGAIVAIRACAGLQFAQNPVTSAASGLIAANLVLFLLMSRPTGSIAAYGLIAVPLLCLLLPVTIPARLFTFESSRNLRQLWIFLPFILLFHVVGGLMYSVLYPAYLQAPLLPGLELLFYIGSVAGSVQLVARRRELSLVGGILLAMLAFTLLQHPSLLGINFSMYAMQAGQGLVDLFLIAYLLTFQSTRRAFGFGLGTLCLGIFSGQLIGQYLQDFAGEVTFFGLISLNLAALSLYIYRGRSQHTKPLDAPSNNQNTASKGVPPTATTRIPETIQSQLSGREIMVLEHSLSGQTYREIAAQLEISESSVKTYMKRVYEKLDIHSRKGLFDLLRL